MEPPHSRWFSALPASGVGGEGLPLHTVLSSVKEGVPERVGVGGSGGGLQQHHVSKCFSEKALAQCGKILEERPCLPVCASWRLPESGQVFGAGALGTAQLGHSHSRGELWHGGHWHNGAHVMDRLGRRHWNPGSPGGEAGGITFLLEPRK